MEGKRLKRLGEAMKERGIDCVAVMPGSNLRYLAGVSFHPSERPLLAFLPAQGRPGAVVPAFEASRFASGPAGMEWRLFPWSDEDGPAAAFAAAAKTLGLAGKKLAIEETLMRVRELRLLEAASSRLSFLDAEPLLTSLRIRKDSSEVACMRKAVELTEAVLEAVLKVLHPGMSERAIAGLLASELRERGAEGLSFEPIVVSGPNSALPHGQPGERKLGEGDPLLFDFGAIAGGYASDITRTVFIGKAEDELKKVYEVVKRANQAGREAARPAREIQEVDRAARRVIVEAGYGQYFTHRTGHGLGLEIHEPPYAREGDRTILEEGMTFTVEPGIYLPGKGGVRIEDDLLITPDGCESLTTFGRDLKVL